MFPREHIRPLSVNALGNVDLLGLAIELAAKYSHVSWTIGMGPFGTFTAFESTSPRARFFDIREYDDLTVPQRQIDIYHYYDPEKAKEYQENAYLWCKAREGMDYPELELATKHLLSRIGFNVDTTWDETWVCSGLIIAGFYGIGLPVIDAPPETGGPDDLTSSPRLELAYSKPWGEPWEVT